MAKQIYIPFLPVMISAILQGKKCCTSRNKKYGSPGDYFKIQEHRYTLIEVAQLTLKDVSVLYFEDEGVSSTEEFIHLWEKIHPLKKFVPEQLVWVHWWDFSTE